MSKNKPFQTLSLARRTSESAPPDKATIALVREAAVFGLNASPQTMMKQTGMGYKELSQMGQNGATITHEQAERVMSASQSLGFVAQPKMYV